MVVFVENCAMDWSILQLWSKCKLTIWFKVLQQQFCTLPFVLLPARQFLLPHHNLHQIKLSLNSYFFLIKMSLSSFSFSQIVYEVFLADLWPQILLENPNHSEPAKVIIIRLSTTKSFLQIVYFLSNCLWGPFWRLSIVFQIVYEVLSEDLWLLMWEPASQWVSWGDHVWKA